MRLKSFQADSLTEAMRQVRNALGEDAIIVNTREEPGGRVRVTAAVETGISADAPAYEPRYAVFAREEMQNAARREEEVVETLTDAMLHHRVPSSVSEKIISCAMSGGFETTQAALAQALDSSFSFRPLPAGKHSKPIMLVGPPGAGKTLAAAKLAARARLNDLTPAVITTDTVRAGGVEQLSAFLRVLSLDLHEASDHLQLKEALQKVRGADQIIIDTGGLNPFDPQEMKTLARLLSTGDIEAVLVLPAGGDAEESAEIAQTFRVLGVKWFLPTRLDFARRLGGILAAAEKAGLDFADASHNPQVANGLLPLSPQALAEKLLPHG